MTVYHKIQIRQDTAANWASINPVLLQGEMGLETDTRRTKTGNGSSNWNNLPYDDEETRILAALANNTYEGTNLQTKFAAEISGYSSVADWLHARCEANNFYGIHPFDYWYENTTSATIDGNSVSAKSRKCTIAGIDLYYGTGDSGNLVSKHHVTVFAGLTDNTVLFNPINSNNGSSYSEHPWIASKCYAVLNGVNTTGTNQQGSIGFNAENAGYLQIFSSALRNRMVQQRAHLGKRYSSSSTLTDDNSQAWVNRGLIFAPSEIEAYGCMIHSVKAGFPQSDNYGPFCHWPIFKSAGLRGRLLSGRRYFWLCSVAGGSSTYACSVTDHGLSACISTTNTGVYAPLCFHLA